MFVIVLEFEVKPDVLDSFIPAIRENAATSVRDEPECHQFDVCQNPEEPELILLYEVYTDKAAFKAHVQSEHFAKFEDDTTGMVVAKKVRSFSLLAA